MVYVKVLFLFSVDFNQGGLNKKKIELNLCKILSIFNEHDLFA